MSEHIGNRSHTRCVKTLNVSGQDTIGIHDLLDGSGHGEYTLI